jgi:hypothetical protein
MAGLPRRELPPIFSMALALKRFGAISAQVRADHAILPGSGHNLRPNRLQVMWRLLAMVQLMWLGPPSIGPARAVICPYSAASIRMRKTL